MDRMVAALPKPEGMTCQRVDLEDASMVLIGSPVLGGLVGVHVTAPGRSVAICVDGQIGNLGVIAAEVNCRGEPGHVVLAEAYCRWGLEVVSRLVGTFALVIVDPSRQTIAWACDWVASTPIYWAREESNLISFGSLPNAVSIGVGLRPTLDARTVRRELVGLDVLAPDTMFRGVKSIGPGMLLCSVAGRITSRRYRSFESMRMQSASTDSLVSAMREGIEEGIDWYRDKARSDVAVSFSGGLDSSAILGAACSRGDYREQVVAVTGVSSGEAEADLKFADAVVKRCGCRWDWSRAEPKAIPDEVLKCAANPVRIGDLCFSLEVFQRARSLGCELILSGALGDVVGGVGYGWTLEMLRAKQFRVLRDELGTMGLLRALPLLSLRLASYSVGASRWIRQRARGVVKERLKLIGVTGAEERELLQESWEMEHRAALPGPDYATWLGWVAETAFPTELQPAGFLGRVTGLEVGSPFAHPKVLAAAFSLPPHLRYRRGVSRVALREAARPWVPEEVLSRRQKLYLTDHLQPLWEREYLRWKESEDILVLRPYVDVDAFRTACDCRGSLSTNVVCSLYEISVLGRWLGLNASGVAGIG